MLAGCATRYVTVPEYHYESHNTTDTVFHSDSVLKENNTIIREADSTMLDELGIRLKQGERAILVLRKELERVLSQQREAVHDTIIKTDSVRVPYPVERELSFMQKEQIKCFRVVVFLLLVLVVIYFVRWLIKRKIMQK